MDEPRLRALYDGSRERLWAYLYRITGDAALADDLVQESFVRICEVAADRLEIGRERAYLFRIATNLANDHFRRRGRLGRTIAALLGRDAPHAADPRPAHEMQAVFDRLRPRERALLWLAHVEGHDHRAIAEILGLQPASIRVLLSRARGRLADLITASKSTSAAALRGAHHEPPSAIAIAELAAAPIARQRRS